MSQTCVFVVALLLCLVSTAWTACPSGVCTAASCSTADVQSAITTAVDGDRILIPNGSCTWTTGISTTKQIIIRAQTYTPTFQGATTRSVILTNNSATTPLFTMQTGNSFHTGLAGIRVNEGTGTSNVLEVTGSGTKVFLLADMYLEGKQRNGSSQDIDLIDWQAQGGVIWNTRIIGQGTGGTAGVGTLDGMMVIKGQARAWNTASTMGALDTAGTINTYIEDSYCANVQALPDLDDDGRAVVRYSVLDGCIGVTHGFTSTWGGRHIEYYNNTFSVTNEARNHTGRYYWVRAATALFTDNVVNDAAEPSNYGHVDLINIGDNVSPGSYPMARQPGWGHNGTTNVIDPIYSWNNTGARAYTWGFNDEPGGWEAIVLENREIYVNNGAKPGYSKYTYPHPARAALEATSAAPTVTITAPTSSPTFSVSATPLTTLAGSATDDVGVVSVTWTCPTCTPTSGTATCATCGASATAPSWSVASIGLTPGDNVITVTATDGESQASAPDTLTVTYTSAAAVPTVLRLIR